MNKIKYLFLENSYKDLKKTYSEALHGDIKSWDVVVLTASNDMQAKTYELQLENRRKQNLLPKNTDFIVIPDVDGKRIGSGGATLNVLLELSKKYNILEKKILIIHSGGDSKRIPQYSCLGKLFSKIPSKYTEMQASTLFDETIMLMYDMPRRMDNGVFIMCGDSLVLFNPLQVDLQYKKAAVISMKMPKDVGVNHGVFVSDSNNVVTEFLHKQPLSILENKAVDKGYVDFDTGMMYFNSEIINDLLQLVNKSDMFNLFVSSDTCLNIYGDFLYPLAKDTTIDNYLKEKGEISINDNLIECRNILLDILKKYELKIIKLSPSLFLHFGTTKEFLEIMTEKIDDYYYLNWKNNIASFSDKNYDSTIVESILINSKLGDNVYLENSFVENSIIGNNVVISNTNIVNQKIPDNVALSTVILENGKFVTRIYDIDLDPKKEINENTKMFNSNNQIMKMFTGKTFWQADLFIVESDMESSLNSALNLYNMIKNGATSDEINAYKNLERISFYNSFNSADSKKIIDNAIMLQEQILTKKIFDIIKKHDNLYLAKEIAEKSNMKEKIIEDLKNNFSNCDDMRTNYLLSLLDEENKNYHLNKSFHSIKSSILSNKQMKSPIFNKEKVEIFSPVRVNFGGGWSDTPPYCIENGGCVLNASIKVNGNYPISVTVEKINSKKLIFSCVDFNDESEIKTIEELRNCSNPSDSYALLKCAMIISGLLKESDTNLSNLFDRIGGGLQITTNTIAIPRGSGLGTSSILSGTVLKAIYQFMNIEMSDDEISYEVLKLEQLMSTGGGWQDQVGGLVKGLKLITTDAGPSQKLNIKKIQISDNILKELNNRLLLINTSQRRLARNLLRDVMGKYICGNEDTKSILKEIQYLAKDMAVSLENGEIDEFGKHLNKHWELSKKLDSGCTNTCIEFIFKSIEDLIDGRFICGAGGGGFLLILLKKNVTKVDIDNRIYEIFHDSGVTSWSLEIEV